MRRGNQCHGTVPVCSRITLALIDKMGLPVEKFGDSKGRIDLVSEV